MAECLTVSQPRISHSGNGGRVVKPRDVRTLRSGGPEDHQRPVPHGPGIRAAGLVARLWRHPPEGLYRPRHRCRLLANLRASRTPWAAQTLAHTHTHTVIGATTPSLHRRKDRHAARSTAVPAARIHDPACPPRLRAVPDEAALRRVIGGPHIMREQLDHLNAPGAQPHISVQVLPLCRRYPSGPVRTVLHSGLLQVAGVGYRRDKEGTRHSGPAGAGR
ncbi:Scr1 family TA system antitoxin-like transcriptional regulator [Streptomyces sp. NPDC014623]|uniref:Scr1 family TA system antitoxin-like transcriptional regulator n=1 Tax=Streptomyces sp. NPDC014623 TaxID=3364875 RepID=UPI0036FA42C8